MLKKIFYLIFVLLLSYFAIVPFFHPGFFSIHDDTQIARTFEMTNSLLDGMFPVRWVENLGYGYGYPIFNFYAPLPYYVGGFLGLIGFSALSATKIAFAFGVLLAGISMYFFIKEFLGKIPAVVSAVIYMYFPYHAVNIFIRGNLNEVFAYALFPFVFLGFYKLYYVVTEKNAQSTKWVILLGVSLACVISSHNLSAYMISVILFLLTVCALIFSQEKIKLLSLLSISGLIAFGLSSFYWMPVLLEMKYSDVLSQVGGGADYRDHFVCLSQYWNSPWGFGGSGPGCIDGMSFKLGKFNILITILSLGIYGYLLITRKIKKHHFLFLSILGVLLFSIFISLEYSSVLWGLIPRIDFLQFPWRFINFIAISMSVFAGLFVKNIIRLNYKFVSISLCIGVIFVTIFLNAKLFVPQTFFDRSSEYYTNTKFVRWDTSKISDEYMPANFSVPQSENEIVHNKIIISSSSATVELQHEKTGFVSAVVSAQNRTDLLLAIAPFPAWKIFINDIEVKYINTDKGIQVEIPEGTSTLEAKFIQTPIEKFSNGITLITAVALISWIILKRTYVHKTNK